MNQGCYQVLFELKDNITVTVGAVGHFVLPEGYYIFSSKENGKLNEVLKRNYLKSKKIRFHLDYLSIHPEFYINSIFVYPELFNPCLLHQYSLKKTLGHELIPNFGIYSDDNCYSHLIYNIDYQEKAIKNLRKSFQQIKWELKNA